MSYTRFYDSALLDDIHNYFPDLLYIPERFRSITEVLSYVQTQTRNRFDLFSRGRREHLEREHVRIDRENTRIVTNALRTPSISMLFGESRAAMPAETVAMDLLNALNGILVPPRQQVMPPAGFLDPVVVRPTAAQIESATALEIVDAEEEICAVCQDRMPAGSQALNLNACDHRFHDACIRTWLQQNVACPVCRHDIREA
jgi:hypothetical protein